MHVAIYCNDVPLFDTNFTSTRHLVSKFNYASKAVVFFINLFDISCCFCLNLHYVNRLEYFKEFVSIFITTHRTNSTTNVCVHTGWPTETWRFFNGLYCYFWVKYEMYYIKLFLLRVIWKYAYHVWKITPGRSRCPSSNAIF